MTLQILLLYYKKKKIKKLKNIKKKKNLLFFFYKVESIRIVKCIANIVNFRFADKL